MKNRGQEAPTPGDGGDRWAVYFGCKSSKRMELASSVAISHSTTNWGQGRPRELDRARATFSRLSPIGRVADRDAASCVAGIAADGKPTGSDFELADGEVPVLLAEAVVLIAKTP